MQHMTRTALARHVGVDRATIWRLEKRGIIPPPERISGKCSHFGPAAVMAAESAVLAAKGA